ncbi:MAG: hypothetical protein JST86_00585 [Bacteroidetes bacterium]|nr:hypothetical protein [Bacteroidota bacterium]
MRLQTIVLGLVAVIVIMVSCHTVFDRFANHNGLSISVNESAHSYQLFAKFNRKRTKDVLQYIDEYAGNNSIFHSGNVEIDACTYLEDQTRVYIYSHPGSLKIKFDKDENSEESYEKVKEMCEGIKDVLSQNQ